MVVCKKDKKKEQKSSNDVPLFSRRKFSKVSLVNKHKLPPKSIIKQIKKPIAKPTNYTLFANQLDDL